MNFQKSLTTNAPGDATGVRIDTANRRVERDSSITEPRLHIDLQLTVISPAPSCKAEGRNLE